MATIREDVVSISFDVENNPFAELTAQMDEVKQSVTGGVNDANNELKKLANGAETAGDGLDELAKTAKDLNDAGTPQRQREQHGKGGKKSRIVL